jgi:tRNA (guanine37-N1)-methyltransferase
MSEGVLDHRFKIGVAGGWALIPISGPLEGLEEAEADLEPRERRPTDYREIASVPEGLRPLLPSSHDVVGDIAVMRVPEPLIPHRREIGEALMRASPSLRAVMMDGGVKGELRIRDLELIAGSGPSETIHREHGLRMAVDPSKVYFNPRLAGERMRVASLVRDGETVIDMFAGAAPFGLVICRHARPSMVYSIDLNPDAGAFAERSAEMNRIDNLTVISGDAAEAMGGLPMADRIIMNLPQSADGFLPLALSRLRPGGTAHMHKVLERSALEAYSERLREEMAALGLGMRVSLATELKTYSPTMSVYVFDVARE